MPNGEKAARYGFIDPGEQGRRCAWIHHHGDARATQAAQSARCRCFVCFLAHDTGIPRRVDLRTKRVVWCLNLSRQVWIVRRGCGKSVTRHHRQRDASFFVCGPGTKRFGRTSSVGVGSLLETPLHLTEAPSSSDTQCPPRHLPLDLMHTRGPAEFKHIIKRRKRN